MKNKIMEQEIQKMWLCALDAVEEVRQKCAGNPQGYTQERILEECKAIAEASSLDVESFLGYVNDCREKVTEKPLAYPKDYLVRLISAHLAECAGFSCRLDWTSKLKEIPESSYAKRYYGVSGEFHY